VESGGNGIPTPQVFGPRVPKNGTVGSVQQHLPYPPHDDHVLRAANDVLVERIGVTYVLLVKTEPSRGSSPYLRAQRR